MPRKRSFPIVRVALVLFVLALVAIVFSNYRSMQIRAEMKKEATEQLTRLASEARDYFSIHYAWPPHDWEIWPMITVDSVRTDNFRYVQDTDKDAAEFIAHATQLNADSSTNRQVVTMRVATGDVPKFTYQGF